jgi:adenylate cyclase
MLGLAYLFGGRYETAAALFRERMLLVPDTDWSRSFLIAALGHLGRVEEARRVHAELMAINPRYNLRQRLDRQPINPTPRQVELVLDGWRKAGLEP